MCVSLSLRAYEMNSHDMKTTFSLICQNHKFLARQKWENGKKWFRFGKWNEICCCFSSLKNTEKTKWTYMNIPFCDAQARFVCVHFFALFFFKKTPINFVQSLRELFCIFAISSHLFFSSFDWWFGTSGRFAPREYVLFSSLFSLLFRRWIDEIFYRKYKKRWNLQRTFRLRFIFFKFTFCAFQHSFSWQSTIDSVECVGRPIAIYLFFFRFCRMKNCIEEQISTR